MTTQDKIEELLAFLRSSEGIPVAARKTYPDNSRTHGICGTLEAESAYCHYLLHFLGTTSARVEEPPPQGSIAPSETKCIEDFLSNTRERQVVLVQQGTCHRPYVMDNMIHIIMQNNGLLPAIVLDEFGYCADKALKKGLHVKNVDSELNPHAIEKLEKTFGLTYTQKQLMDYLDKFFPGIEYGNNELRNLKMGLPSKIIRCELGNRKTKAPKGGNPEKIRGQYIKDTTITELRKFRHIYVIANTRYIAQILAGIAKHETLIPTKIEHEIYKTPEIAQLLGKYT